MYTHRYILKGHTPVLVPNLEKWVRWAETAARHVGDDTIGSIRISTVFLCFDQNQNHGPGPPLLFETIVFGGHDSTIERKPRLYATWEAAEIGHRDLVATIKAQTS